MKVRERFRLPKKNILKWIKMGKSGLRISTLKFVLLLLLMASLIPGCANHVQDKAVEAEAFAMGTIISQKVYGEKAQAAVDETLGAIKKLESLLTFNSEEGDIYQINQNAGLKPVKVSPTTRHILETALKIARLSEGAFDPTIGPIVRSWSIGSPDERIPAQAELSELLPLIDYQDVLLDGTSAAGLKNKGQMIDLGGIAKGYAGDCALQIYRKNGCLSALINLGGNVVALGGRPDGSPWRIGIQDPRSANGRVIGFVEVVDKAVVTAGDYQRYFVKDGKRYHHIFDPRSGRPAASGLWSVTIIADSSMEADALSTAVFVMGVKKGLELIERYGQAEAILITSEQKVIVTDGLRNNFQFLPDSNGYQYEKGQRSK